VRGADYLIIANIGFSIADSLALQNLKPETRNAKPGVPQSDDFNISVM